MGQRSVYDPHDPWAFRNTWSGEIRNSYDDLWIWVTLIVGVTLLALGVLVPIMLHIYCRSLCKYCPYHRCFDRLLSTCFTMDFERRERCRRRKCSKSAHYFSEEEGPMGLEEYARSSSRPDGHLHRPHHRYRSYPEGFYPRDTNVPCTAHRNKRRFYSHSPKVRNPKTVQTPSVPRLKLDKI